VEALGSVRDRDARAQLFGLINADVQRIDRLITDISAASRLDAELSRTRMQPVDLAALVTGIVGAMQASGPPADGVGLAVSVPDRPALVAADAVRLGQVVNNLIDNAMSFSPPGGTVTLAVRGSDGAVELAVEDEGPGVPPEARDAIFERFYSERPLSENFGHHSGLGLSIARAIVEALDGQIRAGDRLDGRQGARFVVSFPAL
jgi:two-component system, OmpR family, sensor histidine kinase ChvG